MTSISEPVIAEGNGQAISQQSHCADVDRFGQAMTRNL
jgi:hypothetical protein